MSVASLAGYLTNSGGGSGGDTFENIYIGESGTQVQLSCTIKNKLNINGITTAGVDIYNNEGTARIKLTCNDDDVLDINNLITYTVQLANETTTNNTVFLSCDVDKTLSVGNIKITEKGITFPDDSVQTVAYTGGGGGNTFDTVTIGADTATVEISCDTANVLLINGVNAATQPYVDDTFQPIAEMTNYQTTTGMADYLTTASAGTTYQTTAGMTDYLTTANAGTTYQTIADMADYLTTGEANALYQPKATHIVYAYQRVYNGEVNIKTGQTYIVETANQNTITSNIPYNADSLYSITFSSGVNSAPVTLVSYTTAKNGGSPNTDFSMVLYNSSTTAEADIHIVSIFAYVPS